jgi:uncharacterized protein (TIGR00725 family)
MSGNCRVSLEAQFMIIGVVGGDKCSAEMARTAEEVGAELARRNCILICGGRGGVMEAACKGARGAGGLTIGILPGPDRSEANRYVSVPIVTNMGEARNAIIVQSSEGIIALDGGYGTLSEIALALRRGIPVVGIKTWSLAIDGTKEESILQAATAAEAVEMLLGGIAAR